MQDGSVTESCHVVREEMDGSVLSRPIVRLSAHEKATSKAEAEAKWLDPSPFTCHLPAYTDQKVPERVMHVFVIVNRQII